MEVRSLLNLLTRTGDRNIEWVRSHQELMRTDDHELRRKRAALTLADEAAKASHTYRMTGSCMGWLSLDLWMLLDPDGRPVLGNTLRHMRNRQREVQRHKWLTLEASKAEAKQVMTADERGMVWRYRWGMPLCRFYWRARFGLLHTSAVKHRLDRRWSPSCRCCEEECRDTQSHRFGLSQPVCCNTTELENQLHVMHAALERDLWLPDQHLFIPILGHEAAKGMELPQRPRWKEDNGRQVAWQPMVNIEHGHWCDAQWISWIGDIRQASIRQYLWRALSNGTYLRRAYPAGRLIPQRLQDAARRSMDNKASFASMHLVQWTPGWATATFDQGPWINAFSVEQRLAVPSTVQGWWLDDVYFPCGEGWWEDTEVRITTELSRAELTVYWIAVYANTPGFGTVNRLGGQWLVRIPSGKLRMRTDYAVAQQQQQPRRRITSTNFEVIMIGIVAAPQRITAHVHAARHIWAPVLHDYYSPSWLLAEYSAQTTHVSVHPIFELGFVHDHPPSRLLWWTDARRQMELLFPQIYGASTGWRRYPTLSAACEDWARSLSYTSKEATTLLRRFLTDHWDTLRRYWELTCRRTNDAIEDTDDVATRDRVNNSIRSRREAHARRPGARVDKLLARRQLRLTEMSDYWTTQRTVVLDGQVRRDPARQ
ncbi:hypothetical protein PHYSODRAFT_298074 [Phytophthora sojae]|uniref:Uncharacterized protein n=1 Tax=Phytophthora sojae (strain P6497) TaxID=1094619 RepID=G4Z6K3_PHYSP|nr:hypothetical protein PHYSODRAFT_298074 [Phytophthora sojae]EGZ19573.1 hypothetical protein PHYSODRAFT_298074 [Phytophthora sojae]|eukprot:XP_009522290.1 hypothetical protein PHYSODRAFT_298074 [Phytophthora sojae]